MVAIKTLLPELRKLVTELTEDLLARSTSDAKIDAGLRDAYVHRGRQPSVKPVETSFEQKETKGTKIRAEPERV